MTCLSPRSLSLSMYRYIIYITAHCSMITELSSHNPVIIILFIVCVLVVHCSCQIEDWKKTLKKPPLWLALSWAPLFEFFHVIAVSFAWGCGEQWAHLACRERAVSKSPASSLYTRLWIRGQHGLVHPHTHVCKIETSAASCVYISVLILTCACVHVTANKEGLLMWFPGSIAWGSEDLQWKDDRIPRMIVPVWQQVPQWWSDTVEPL